MQIIPEYLSKHQLLKLSKHMCTPMMKDALFVMYVYALRISEVCSITREQVDWDHDVIRISGKGKVRELPIVDETRDMLARAVGRPGKLFNVSVRSFRNYVYQAASKSEVGHVHPHMIRHSRATHMLNDGESLPGIQAWMRHDYAGSTLIYTHVATDYLREVGKLKAVPVQGATPPHRRF